MDLEKQRGISVSSTVLQFDYDNYRINLLDTPGHHDFSEDTYRVLTAVDAAIMVIDAGKGIEAQTRKLFEVCRRRGVPIFTFINKLDRPAREPLDLLDELEKVLGIESYAVNWPLGAGDTFKGVFDRLSGEVHLFERTVHGAYRAPVEIGDFSSPLVRDHISETVYEQVREELEMLDGAGASFDRARIRAWPTHAGVFRQRHEQLRRAINAGQFSVTFLAAHTTHFHAGRNRARCRVVFRLCV
jgi:peptide chain release factor 3